MRRHVGGVQPDGQPACFLEQLGWHCGDRDEGGRVLHALGVLGGAEDVDFVVGGAEGFHPFIALLALAALA